MTDAIHILCFGKDPRLLHTRNAVLARQYLATSVDSLTSLLDAAARRSFEVVVLCHTLSETEYQQAVSMVHLRHPQAGIIAMTAAAAGAPRTPVGADHALRGLDGPKALLAIIYSTLMERHLLH